MWQINIIIESHVTYVVFLSQHLDKYGFERQISLNFFFKCMQPHLKYKYKM